MSSENVYCSPHGLYEDGEVMICCPICGNPSDYCTDHNHWNCEDCGNPLEIEDSEIPKWHCDCDCS